MAIIIVISIFVVIWGWIAYEIHRAPTCDKDGNEIKPRKGRWIKLSKRDIDKDLFKKEDVD